jgi:hypothetical protein
VPTNYGELTLEQLDQSWADLCLRVSRELIAERAKTAALERALADARAELARLTEAPPIADA